MKKKLLLIAGLSSLFLVSCTATVNDKNISDEDITTDVLDYYKVNFDNNTVHLVDTTKKITNKTHYEVYFSQDAEKSLFRVETNITEIVKKKKSKLTKYTAESLQFYHKDLKKSSDLIDEMIDEVENQLYDSKDGLSQYVSNDEVKTNSLKLDITTTPNETEEESIAETTETNESSTQDISFDIDFEIVASINPKLNLKKLYDFYKEDGSDIYVNIVYIPLNVYKYSKKNQLLLHRYVFAPIYVELNDKDLNYSIDGKEKKESLIKNIDALEVKFKDAKKQLLSYSSINDGTETESSSETGTYAA